MITVEVRINEEHEQFDVRIQHDGALADVQKEAIALFHALAAELNRESEGTAGSDALSAALVGIALTREAWLEPVEEEADDGQAENEA